jgi:hypothetical protein
MRLRQKGIVILILALGLLALVPAEPVRAFPPSPQPLWKLAEESDLIVVAEVQKVRKFTVRSKQGGSYGKAVAVLRIREHWKGNESGTIEVPYLTDMICPSLPVYLEGKNVLAFLKRAKAGSGEAGWRTVGLSNGTLYPDRSELAELRERVGRTW